MPPTILSHVHGLARAIGFLAAARVLALRALGVRKLVTARVGRGCSNGAQIILRPLDSDLFVASAIFGWEEYQLDTPVKEALQRIAHQWTTEGIRPTVVDGGANVGYSSVYFAKTFRNVTVLAVEPDPEAFRILQANTQGLENIQCVHGALWLDDGGVDLRYAREGSWATSTVAAAAASTARTPSFRIDQVTGRIPNCRVLILKLDIEGAERQACHSCPGIVADAPCVIVEPHDFISNGSGSLSSIFSAIATKEVDTYIKGENLVFVDSALLRTTN